MTVLVVHPSYVHDWIIERRYGHLPKVTDMRVMSVRYAYALPSDYEGDPADVALKEMKT